MSRFVLHHRHEADECGAVFASFKGHNSPLRRKATLASCRSGGHAIWWTVDAASEADALALLPVLRRRADHRGDCERSRHPMNPSKGATMSRVVRSPPPEIAFLVGIPLAWAVLLLFHPERRGGGHHLRGRTRPGHAVAGRPPRNDALHPTDRGGDVPTPARHRGHRGARQPDSTGALRRVLRRL